MSLDHQCYTCLWFQRPETLPYRRCQKSPIEVTPEGLDPKTDPKERYHAIFPDDHCNAHELEPDISGIERE